MVPDHNGLELISLEEASRITADDRITATGILNGLDGKQTNSLLQARAAGSTGRLRVAGLAGIHPGWQPTDRCPHGEGTGINPLQEPLHLVADVGGTHIRFAQCRGATVQAMAKYRCADFGGLTEAINHYLQCHATTAIDRACLAVAAPTGEPDIMLTNNSWRFNVARVREQFGFNRLEVINDFEAIAYCIPRLEEKDLFKIGGRAPDRTGTVAVLGPGTGLGVKHLTAVGRGWKVLAGEGGHVDFAPVDEDDMHLWQFLHATKQPVTAEEVLSGRGLVNIYRSIMARRNRPEAVADPAAIVERGLTRTCNECAAALHQFMRILGSFAGNLALTLNTAGGVYLHGGIVTRLRDPALTAAFRHRFENKGRFRFCLVDIPVFLITREEPGLLGAALYLETCGKASRHGQRRETDA